MPDFLHVYANSHKLKVDHKNSDWAWSEMGVTSQVAGLYNWLYLKNELMEWTDL